MQSNLLVNILGRRFRANPGYRLVAFEDLSRARQELLLELRADPTFYGVLLPRDANGLSVKSVCRDTARLFAQLTIPQSAAAPLPEDLGESGNSTLARLVLDGILELETNQGFVSGPRARREIFQTAEVGTGAGAILDLSIAALRYGQTLRLNDSQALSARLYFYNRLPVTPKWRAAMPDAEASLTFLGLEPGSATWNSLDAAWREAPVAPGFEGWRVFKPKAAQGARESRFKLYLSPVCEALRETLVKTVPVLRELGAPRFKIGRDVYNLLRPDKMVVYFFDFRSLCRAGDALASALRGVPVHGVPFTADYAGDGLLSWGADPPRTETVLSWQERESWRLWLTNRLASALLDARDGADNSMEPWRYALQRLQLEGIDTTRWAPAFQQSDSRAARQTHGR